MQEANQTPVVKKKTEGRWRRKNATFKNYILLLKQRTKQKPSLKFFYNFITWVKKLYFHYY